MSNNHKPAILPATVRPSLHELEPRAVRQATALDEIRQMADDMQRMSQELSECYREIDARGNKIELLQNELNRSQDSEKVYRRKLIRLAAHQEQLDAASQMFSRLCQNGSAIMADVREVNQVEEEREAAGGDDGRAG